MTNLDDYINSGNPLTRDTALFLVAYAEEDNRVDYKQTVDLDSEKQWLELTKDISALANTRGGYLVSMTRTRRLLDYQKKQRPF